MDSDLIDNVEKYTILYDKRSVGFRNKVSKENAWRSIAEEMGLTVPECESRWASLRSRYATERRLDNKEASGSAASTRPQWVWMERMRFLEQHVRTRKTSGSIYLKACVDTPSPQDSEMMSPSISIDEGLEGNTSEDNSIRTVQDLTRQKSSDGAGPSGLSKSREESRPRTTTPKTPTTSDGAGPSGPASHVELTEIIRRDQRGKRKMPETPDASVGGACQALASYYTGKTNEEDPDIIFGKSVGILLKSLSPNTKRLRQKIIMDVVFGMNSDY